MTGPVTAASRLARSTRELLNTLARGTMLQLKLRWGVASAPSRLALAAIDSEADAPLG